MRQIGDLSKAVFAYVNLHLGIIDFHELHIISGATARLRNSDHVIIAVVVSPAAATDIAKCPAASIFIMGHFRSPLSSTLRLPRRSASAS